MVRLKLGHRFELMPTARFADLPTSARVVEGGGVDFHTDDRRWYGNRRPPGQRFLKGAWVPVECTDIPSH